MGADRSVSTQDWFILPESELNLINFFSSDLESGSGV